MLQKQLKVRQERAERAKGGVGRGRRTRTWTRRRREKRGEEKSVEAIKYSVPYSLLREYDLATPVFQIKMMRIIFISHIS